MRLGLALCLCLSGFGTCGLASEKPTVILYTVAGCRPCQQALASLRELGIEPKIIRDCPAWVTQVPVIHWRDRAGVWRQHAPRHWSGPTWTEAETAKIRRWLLMPSAVKSTGRDPYLTVSALADKFESTERQLEILCDAGGVNLDLLCESAGSNFNRALHTFRVEPVSFESGPVTLFGEWLFPCEFGHVVIRGEARG